MRRMFRLHVGQWFFPSSPGAAPTPSPPEAIASLNTHDTATFAGWWRGGDIDDRRDLGLITDAQDASERRERDDQKRALLAFARATPDDHLAEVERAMVAATIDLATGPAEVMLIALDDLALEPVPHNVPGTSTERRTGSAASPAGPTRSTRTVHRRPRAPPCSRSPPRARAVEQQRIVTVRHQRIVSAQHQWIVAVQH